MEGFRDSIESPVRAFAPLPNRQKGAAVEANLTQKMAEPQAAADETTLVQELKRRCEAFEEQAKCDAAERLALRRQLAAHEKGDGGKVEEKVEVEAATTPRRRPRRRPQAAQQLAGAAGEAPVRRTRRSRALQ